MDTLLTKLNSKYPSEKIPALQQLVDYSDIPEVKEALSFHILDLERILNTLWTQKRSLLAEGNILNEGIIIRREDQALYGTLNEAYIEADAYADDRLDEIATEIYLLDEKIKKIQDLISSFSQDYDTSDIPQLTYRDRYNDIKRRLTSAQGSESSKRQTIEDLGRLIEEISQSLRTDAQDEDLLELKGDAEALFKLY